MRSDRRPLLVVGVTGRALAGSAARGGLPVVVLDYFADQDTCANAVACRAVVSAHGMRFDRRRLLAAADALAPVAESAGVVYASGFEGRIGLLQRLLAGRPLFGNAPEVVAAVRDPLVFFPLLDRLDIPHPEVRFLQPTDPTGWLAKQPGGSGGVHVRPALRRPKRAGDYYQRKLSGLPCSALFLADGHRACLVGLNEQWVSSARPELPFLYAGAVGSAPIPDDLEARIRERLDALVAATGLVGLNGIDFLLEHGRWSVLEVNPRPTATMELHDPDHERGLFHAHLEACRGVLPSASPSAHVVRASLIVHAPIEAHLHEHLEFPDWCRDLPRAGTHFAAGAPVCTVFAEATDARRATTLVHERRQTVVQLLSEAAPASRA